MMSHCSYERHHLVPRVRCRELGISPSFSGNVRRVSTRKHRARHTFSGSQTPEKAVETICREWMLDRESQAEFNRLTGNVRLPKQRRKR